MSISRRAYRDFVDRACDDVGLPRLVEDRHSKRPEAAISSPLLEDEVLAEHKLILVTVTAGMTVHREFLRSARHQSVRPR